MDPLGTNKIMAAVLGAALVFMAIRTIPEFLMHHDTPDVPAYSVGPLEVIENGNEPDLPFPQLSWVGAMDAERGAKVFKKCKSCHNIEAGAPHGTGPNLYSVVKRKSGEAAGFGYSSAMASAGYEWGYEELDGFLEKPSTYLPGTKMNFVGLKKPEDRAAVIEYLRVAAANPVPRPEAAAVPLTQEAENATVEPEGGLQIGVPTEGEAIDGDEDTMRDLEQVEPMGENGDIEQPEPFVADDEQ